METETPGGILNRGDLIQGVGYKVLENLETAKAGDTVTQRPSTGVMGTMLLPRAHVHDG